MARVNYNHMHGVQISLITTDTTAGHSNDDVEVRQCDDLQCP